MELYLTTYNNQKRQTSMASAGFEPIIPASDQPQSNALDPAATGIGMEVAYPSERLVSTYQVSRCHNPKYHGINTDRRLKRTKYNYSNTTFQFTLDHAIYDSYL
jgi:hypothetical protein